MGYGILNAHLLPVLMTFRRFGMVLPTSWPSSCVMLHIPQLFCLRFVVAVGCYAVLRRRNGGLLTLPWKWEEEMGNWDVEWNMRGIVTYIIKFAKLQIAVAMVGIWLKFGGCSDWKVGIQRIVWTTTADGTLQWDLVYDVSWWLWHCVNISIISPKGLNWQ